MNMPGCLRSNWCWRACVLGLGVLSTLMAAGVCYFVSPPLRVHDEFSYRLSAETLLFGRLSNPTPPAWEALQSFHVILQPTYASKYPLGVGITIALGWCLFGSVHAGSWLCCGVWVGSCTWMLAGAVTRRWALLGGVLLVVHPLLQVSWSSSLLHGYLPAIGCALLTGSALRLRRRQNHFAALVGGCGIGVLALSRPFEGLCCTLLCVGLLVLAWHHRGWPVRFRSNLAAGGLASLPVLLALALIVAQNHATTGHWWQMPYQLHEQQYGVAPLFIFGQPKMENFAPSYSIPSLFQAFHADESYQTFLARAGWQGWIRGLGEAVQVVGKLAIPCLPLIAFSGLNWLRFRLSAAALTAVVIQLACSSSVCWVYPHYLAPVLPWLVLLAVLALRTSASPRCQLVGGTYRPGNGWVAPIGRQWMGGTYWRVGLVGGTFLLQAAMLGQLAVSARDAFADCWAKRRQSVEQHLLEQSGKHLVMVKYEDWHNVHHEWVYNSADPKASSIVWARYEDGRWYDAVIGAYGQDRTTWLLHADALADGSADLKQALRKISASEPQKTKSPSQLDCEGPNCDFQNCRAVAGSMN